MTPKRLKYCRLRAFNPDWTKLECATEAGWAPGTAKTYSKTLEKDPRIAKQIEEFRANAEVAAEAGRLEVEDSIPKSKVEAQRVLQSRLWELATSRGHTNTSLSAVKELLKLEEDGRLIIETGEDDSPPAEMTKEEAIAMRKAQ